MNSMKRLLDIDIAIGISIILVVLGHLKFKEDPLVWYLPIRNLIYKFHMPLFMFFSGFLISYTYKPIKNFNDYNFFIFKKIKKFISPYLLFAILFVAFEFVTSGYDLKQLKLDFRDMLLYPSKSPAGFLWYIYVLLQFYLCLPILKKLVKKSTLLSILIGVLLQFQTCIEIFNLNLFSFYFLFVILGLIATQRLEEYYDILNKFGYIFVASFIALLVFSSFYTIPKVIMGLFSIPAVHYLSILLVKTKADKILTIIGKHSFYIYLMNTLIMGILYLVFVKKFNFNFSFLLFILFFICGLVLPIIIYRKIIKKNALLNKVIQ